MVQEFEGRSEKEAIDAAAEELGLERDGFDVEVLESQSGSIFKKGYVRIRVHTRDEEPAPRKRVPAAEPVPADEFEAKVAEFTKRMIEGMGYSCEVSVLFREEKKLGLRIDSENASIIIGKKGKNLDALQLLVNVYAGRLGREDTRVILDSENYRIRREESLVRLAYETAEQVRRTRQSVLLEPMNPFERRIIHTTLNDIVDIETKSEGEGLYKQVRVTFRGKI
jgi:spoIIIJ-associated protein